MQEVPSAPLPISLGSEPLATPSKRVHISLTPEAFVLVMVAVSPKLELIPIFDCQEGAQGSENEKEDLPASISPVVAVIPSIMT